MTDSKGAARGRREVLAAGIALLCPAAGSGAASAQTAADLVQPVGFSPRPGVGMRLTFEYVPARDGLALLTGGPSQAGYAAAAAAYERAGGLAPQNETYRYFLQQARARQTPAN